MEALHSTINGEVDLSLSHSFWFNWKASPLSSTRLKRESMVEMMLEAMSTNNVRFRCWMMLEKEKHMEECILVDGRCVVEAGGY